MNKLNLKSTFNFVEIFKNKRVRYGGYAALITLAAAVMVVVLNLIIQLVPSDIDMTENKLFTLSDQTKDLLDTLEKPVVIYGLYPAGAGVRKRCGCRSEV